MNGQPSSNRSLKVLSILTAISLASCASSLNQANKAKVSAPADSVAQMSEQAPNTTPNAPAKEVIPRPQLIKSADITLQVKSIEESSKAISDLVKQHQGDILELHDYRSSSSGLAESVTLKIRIPQERLDAVLDTISQLGIVKGRSLKAEDVSNQLVDLQARLKNLRQTEVQLQEILKQTGSVGDVLKVTQELSRIREAIEQIDAQLTNLKNQVAYSTIQITLSSEIATIHPKSDLGTQIQNTWNSATNSLVDVSIGLLKLAIWLLVYCPYWLIPLAIYLFLRHRRRQLAQAPKPESNVNPD